MTSLGIYHWTYNQKRAVAHSVNTFRKFHKDIPVFLSCDGGENFYDVCNEHNIEYFHSQYKIGYPTPHWGHSKKNIQEFLKRIYLGVACMNTTHFVVSEDDVVCINEIQYDPEWEIAAYNTASSGHNAYSYINDEIQDAIQKVSGKRPNHPYYGTGAGAILRSKTFLDNFDKYMKFLDEYYDRFHLGQPQFGWNDFFIQIMYYVAGRDYSFNPRLYSIPLDDPTNFDEETLKKDYDIVHNYKFCYE